MRRGKLAQPTEFGYTAQYGELTSSTNRGAEVCFCHPSWESENLLLEQSAAEIKELQLELAEAAFDGGLSIKATPPPWPS